MLSYVLFCFFSNQVLNTLNIQQVMVINNLHNGIESNRIKTFKAIITCIFQQLVY